MSEIERLEEVARASIAWSETIGEHDWFEADALEGATIEGLEGVIGKPDAAYIVAFPPLMALAMLAVCKAAQSMDDALSKYGTLPAEVIAARTSVRESLAALAAIGGDGGGAK